MSKEAIIGSVPTDVIGAVKKAMPDSPPIIVDQTQSPEFSEPSQISEFTSEYPSNEFVSQPMIFLPGPKERALFTNWSLLPTAKHEGKHAHVLYQLGYGNQIEYITVRPHGNILGEVSISGHIPFSDFATAAAASSSTLFNDSPSGTSMDRWQITSSGQSFNDHLNRAEGHLKSETPEIMTRVFEIIAYLGTVDGSEYPAILEQARYEIGMESINRQDEIEGRSFKMTLSKPAPEKQTKIIHISPDHYKGVWLKNGEIIAEADIYKCPKCGMFHAAECPFSSSIKNQSEAVPNWPTAENQPIKINNEILLQTIF